METKLYIVGRISTILDTEGYWEYVGIFAKEEDANDACQDYTYFVGPVELDVNVDIKYGKEATEWPGCYYPNRSEPSSPEFYPRVLTTDIPDQGKVVDEDI